MSDEQFSDIAPYQDNLFQPKLAELIEEPGFRHAVEFCMPGVNFDQFCKELLTIKNATDFQRIVMLPFLEWLEKSTTAGVSVSGLNNLEKGTAYTIITNHRDIVLDASFLNLSFLKRHIPTTEIAIGDNLLIYPWIDDLVRLNKSFIVRRNLKLSEALQSARHLSAYINYCITQKHESIWIAQREGRAKDSNDLTQDSLIKMLGLSGQGSIEENIVTVNLLPAAISYEYDPNDYLKITEFINKRRDPEFKKSQHDDLLSMETGMLGFKGQVHYSLTPCISPQLSRLPADTPRAAFIRKACELIDTQIHLGYKIFPINYIAYDKLYHTDRFADKYTPEQVEQAENYIAGQLQKIDIADITPDEHHLMHSRMLEMYVNPLLNKLKAQNDTLPIPVN